MVILVGIDFRSKMMEEKQKMSERSNSVDEACLRFYNLFPGASVANFRMRVEESVRDAYELKY
jgi:hypothetical protein